jgi:hypothetical protein
MRAHGRCGALAIVLVGQSCGGSTGAGEPVHRRDDPAIASSPSSFDTEAPTPIDPLVGAVDVSLSGEATSVIEVAPVVVPSGRVLETALSPDGTTRVIAFPRRLEGRDTSDRPTWSVDLELSSPAIAFSRDGARLAAIDLDGRGPVDFVVLDARSGAELERASVHVPSLRAPPGSRMGLVGFGLRGLVASATSDGFDAVGRVRAPIVMRSDGRAAIDLERSEPAEGLTFAARSRTRLERLEPSPGETTLAALGADRIELVRARDWQATTCEPERTGLASIVSLGLLDDRAWVLGQSTDGETALASLDLTDCTVTRSSTSPEIATASAASWLSSREAFLALSGTALFEVDVERRAEPRLISSSASAVQVSREQDGYVVFSGSWARSRDATGALRSTRVATHVTPTGAVVCGGRLLVSAAGRSVLVRLPDVSDGLTIAEHVAWGACNGDRWLIGVGSLGAAVVDARTRSVIARLTFPEGRAPERSEGVRWLHDGTLVYVTADAPWHVPLPTARVE